MAADKENHYFCKTTTYNYLHLVKAAYLKVYMQKILY